MIAITSILAVFEAFLDFTTYNF